MKWLNKLFRRSINNPNIPIGSADIWDVFGSQQTDSGVAVTSTSILGSAGVWRAVNLISSSIGRMPILVYKRTKDGGRERAVGHPAYRLLKSNPAPYISPFTFVQTLQSHALLYGNGYAYIFRDDFGAPTELVILNPLETVPAKEDGRLLYVTKVGDGDRKLLPENVLHIKGLGFDGLGGWSVVSILKDTFGHDLALLKYGNKFFKHGSAINCVVELQGSFKDAEAIKRFRESWGHIHVGLDNAHKVAILENGAKVSRLASTNEEAQYLQSREFDLKVLANVFGLPASYLQADYNTSYASLEAERRQLLDLTLAPWLTGWEQELQSKLLTEVQKQRDSHFIEFQRMAFERADKKTEIDTLMQQVGRPILTVNEARQMLNLPNIEGGDELQTMRQEPTPQGQEESEETEESKGEDERGKELTKGILRRIRKRLSKDADKAGTPSFIDRHRDVILDNLSTFSNAEEVVDNWLDRLNEELAEVLPEQRQAIIEETDIDTLTEALWNAEA